MPEEGFFHVDKICFYIPRRRGLFVYGCIYLIIQLFRTAINIDALTHYHYKELTGFEIFELILNLINIIFSILLIYGSHTRNPNYLKIFFWYLVVAIVLGIIMDITLSILEFMGYFATLVKFSIYPFFMYVLIVVRSSYLKMELNYRDNYSAQSDVE